MEIIEIMMLAGKTAAEACGDINELIQSAMGVHTNTPTDIGTQVQIVAL